MLSSAEHEIFLLINVKMSTIVGILTFMSKKNNILGLSEVGKKVKVSHILIALGAVGVRVPLYLGHS